MYNKAVLGQPPPI